MDRWGFEEDDDDDRDLSLVDDDEPLVGQDVHGVVTVVVGDDADVRAVRLADGWQDAEVRRGLGARVVEAVTAATARVVARRAEGDNTSPRPVGTQQETPLTTEDVMWLLDRVSADVATFRARMSAVVDEKVRVTSGGGHVTVTGQRRRVADVAMDQDWLYGARASEVESELRDALRAFGKHGEFEELAKGPRSDAISELMAIVGDPATMVRRIRQGAP